jgi:hypothetical protein
VNNITFACKPIKNHLGMLSAEKHGDTKGTMSGGLRVSWSSGNR